MPRPYKLIDTTLREGEQTPGVLFSLDQKRQIIDGLAAAGIDEVEIGLASPLAAHGAELAGHCRARHPGLRISLWSRCRPDDIDHGAALRPDVLSLSMPVSDLHLVRKLGRDRDWALVALVDSIQSARRRGVEVSVGFEDATRADPDFLVQMAAAGERAGARRIRVADTVGVASPAGIQRLVTFLAEALDSAEVGIHAHNDFGMATANSVAALESGAGWADGTILGLGERCGCARLEELVGYLQLARGCTDLDIGRLKELCVAVARFSGRAIPGHRPLLGEEIFCCETGIHLQGLLADPETYEPFAPEAVGARRTLLFGPKSGRRALRHLRKGPGQVAAAGPFCDEDQAGNWDHNPV